MQPGPVLWVQMDLDSVGPEAHTVGSARLGVPFKEKNTELGTEPWKGPVPGTGPEASQRDLCGEENKMVRGWTEHPGQGKRLQLGTVRGG